MNDFPINCLHLGASQNDPLALELLPGSGAGFSRSNPGPKYFHFPSCTGAAGLLETNSETTEFSPSGVRFLRPPAISVFFMIWQHQHSGCFVVSARQGRKGTHLLCTSKMNRNSLWSSRRPSLSRFEASACKTTKNDFVTRFFEEKPRYNPPPSVPQKCPSNA